MKKKNLLSMIVALSLVGVIMVGASLAYLTDRTEEKVNVFTIGNVKIDLDEPHWEEEKAQNLKPGAEVTKDPTVTNVGENDAFVAVTVDGMAEMQEAQFSAKVNSGWTKVLSNGEKDPEWDGTTLEDGIYAYDKALAKDEPTTPLFDKVKLSEEYETLTYHIVGEAVDPDDESKGAIYKIIDNKGNTLEEEFASKEAAESRIKELEAEITCEFKLTLKAYAIQTDGFETMSDWVKELFTE